MTLDKQAVEPLSKANCARCGKPLNVQPGETFVGSTDGRVWHYGCNSLTPAALVPQEEEVGRMVERLRRVQEYGHGPESSVYLPVNPDGPDAADLFERLVGIQKPK